MNEIVCVVGAGGHASVVISVLDDIGYEIDGVYDDDIAKIGSIFMGSVVKDSILNIEKSEVHNAIIGIGSNKVRKELALSLDKDWISCIHSRAYVHHSVKIGKGSVIFAGAVIQPNVVIGDHVIINTGATIDHDCIIEDYAHVCPGAHIGGGVKIGCGAWVGIGSSVVQYVNIGEWATIGAGACVIKSIPSSCTAVGVPAKVIKTEESCG